MCISKRELSVLLGLVLALIISSFASFAEGCADVREATLRLHVLANSDSAADQALKLKVRDALLDAYGTQLGAALSKAEAEQITLANAAAMRETAISTLRANGCLHDVSVTLENAYFDTKQYGEDVTLPAGKYDAVRVEIGTAAGHNWFCVMYPQLCLTAAGGAKYTKPQQKTVAEKATVKFAIVETVEKIKDKIEKRKNDAFGVCAEITS